MLLTSSLARPLPLGLAPSGGRSGAALLRQQRRQRQRGQQQAAAAALSEVLSLAEASEAFGSAMQAAPSAAASDALAAAQVAVESDPTELVFSVLFTVAVAALSVVTLGVAYLSFTTWNDGRLEAEDRARFDSRGYGPSSNGATPSKKAKAAAAAAPPAPEEFKGFGKK